MNTPIGRDFKRNGVRSGHGRRLTPEHWQGFAAGLGLGLVFMFAALAWARSQLRDAPAVTAEGQPSTREPGVGRRGGREAAADPAADAGADAAAQYDFYDRLKRLEVVVPEQDKDVRPDVPTSLIERPGTYVLQPGAWRDAAEAERLRAKLARLGIAASTQRVVIDTDEFHRVRIGPFSDLGELNRTRAALRAADIDALVIRVGD